MRAHQFVAHCRRDCARHRHAAARPPPRSDGPQGRRSILSSAAASNAHAYAPSALPLSQHAAIVVRCPPLPLPCQPAQRCADAGTVAAVRDPSQRADLPAAAARVHSVRARRPAPLPMMPFFLAHPVCICSFVCPPSMPSTPLRVYAERRTPPRAGRGRRVARRRVPTKEAKEGTPF